MDTWKTSHKETDDEEGEMSRLRKADRREKGRHFHEAPHTDGIPEQEENHPCAVLYGRFEGKGREFRVSNIVY
jgi:hypothetical protein